MQPTANAPRPSSLAAAQSATETIQRDAEPHRVRMNDRYNLEFESLAARVYYKITDNWLELSLRFIVQDRFSREIKDRIAREILEGFEKAGLGIASTTIDIVGFPPVRGGLRMQAPEPAGEESGKRAAAEKSEA